MVKSLKDLFAESVELGCMSPAAIALAVTDFPRRLLRRRQRLRR